MTDKNITPLISVLVSCPACGKAFLDQRLNAQSYRVTASDTDFFPSQRVWLNQDRPEVNPLAYFMQTCPHCLFTLESNEAFLQKKAPAVYQNYQQKLQIERHSQELHKPECPLAKLAAAYKNQPDPFCKVILKFLLGIYDEKLKDQYSDYNLARYYIRLAWVFRENQAPYKNEISEKKSGLQKNIRRISEQHQSYLGELDGLKDLLEKDFLSISPGSPREAGSPPDLEELLKNLDEEVLPQGEKTQEFLELLNEQAESMESRTSQNQFDRFDLTGFLLELKTVWPGVPLNETEALKFSLSYYNQYFTGLPTGTSSGTHIQTAYLIGELSRRVGEIPESKRFFSLAIDLGRVCLKKERQSYRSVFAQKLIDMAIQQKDLIETERHPSAF